MTGGTPRNATILLSGYYDNLRPQLMQSETEMEEKKENVSENLITALQPGIPIHTVVEDTIFF